jgi:hypothetical protein
MEGAFSRKLVMLNLKRFAEMIEIGLLEQQAIGNIYSYAIQVIPDDYKIEITQAMIVPIKTITVSLKIASKL